MAYLFNTLIFLSKGVAKAHLEGRLKNPFGKGFGEYTFSSKMKESMWVHSPYEKRLIKIMDVYPAILYFVFLYEKLNFHLQKNTKDILM